MQKKKLKIIFFLISACLQILRLKKLNSKEKKSLVKLTIGILAFYEFFLNKKKQNKNFNSFKDKTYR